MSVRESYSVFKAKKDLEFSNKQFDKNLRVNKGAFSTDKEQKELREFLEELNELRGFFLQDAKKALEGFSGDIAVKNGYGTSTRKAIVFKRLGTAFYQVLRAEFALKLAKCEIEEEEWLEFIGE